MGGHAPLLVRLVTGSAQSKPMASRATRNLQEDSRNPRPDGQKPQQAIANMLTPIFEPQYSEMSFGFRPGRGAHGALLQTKRFVEDGCI